MGIYHKPERTILKFDLLNSSIYNTGGNKHAEYMHDNCETNISIGLIDI